MRPRASNRPPAPRPYGQISHSAIARPVPSTHSRRARRGSRPAMCRRRHRSRARLTAKGQQPPAPRSRPGRPRRGGASRHAPAVRQQSPWPRTRPPIRWRWMRLLPTATFPRAVHLAKSTTNDRPPFDNPPGRPGISRRWRRRALPACGSGRPTRQARPWPAGQPRSSTGATARPDRWPPTALQDPPDPRPCPPCDRPRRLRFGRNFCPHRRQAPA